MEEAPRLVPVFMPALGLLLEGAEDLKEAPLTPEEVLRIRDEALCVMMTPDDAAAMTASRGYADIDPENCWHDWQMLRRKLGRKPDLPAGPRFFFFRPDDPGLKHATEQAQASLDDFRGLMAELSGTEVRTMIKVQIVEGERKAAMWLQRVRIAEGRFSGELFELPADFECYAVGDRLTVEQQAVLDWMINDRGTLYGGFSLRYQRSQTPEAQRQAFDDYVGVSTYA